MKDLEVLEFYLSLTETDKEVFASYLRPVSLEKDYVLHYQGDVCKDVLLLMEGSIRLYTQADDSSDEVTLYTLEAGEQCIANTASVLSQSKTIGTAITQTPVKAYLMSEEHTKRFMQESSVYQSYILGLYSKKMFDLTLTIEKIKFKNLDERLMDYLEKNEQKTVKITHQGLANKMNTSRSVISRVLKKLENKGIIKLHHGYIEIAS
jgi:CRP/FNR family transcriptional regulator